MKKLISLAIIMLLLGSCGSSTPSTQNSREDDFIFAEHNRINTTNGMYYFAPVDSDGNGKDVLNYVDYDTCNHAVVCPLPNCPHTDPETCYALGIGNGTAAIVPIGDYIYWTKIDDNKTYLYKAKKDGTDRMREAELPKLTSGDALVLKDNKLYYVGSDSSVDDSGAILDSVPCYLICYDFDTKETTECVKIGELYPNMGRMTSNIDGFFDGKIYAYAMSDSVAPQCFSYDIASGDVTKLDFKPLWFAGGYMIVPGPKLVSPDGTEFKFDAPENGFYGYKVVSDKLITRAYVYDITTGKRYKNLITDAVDFPILYKDGRFLIHNLSKNTFKWVDEAKVIGKETE